MNLHPQTWIQLRCAYQYIWDETKILIFPRGFAIVAESGKDELLVESWDALQAKKKS